MSSPASPLPLAQLGAGHFTDLAEACAYAKKTLPGMVRIVRVTALLLLVAVAPSCTREPTAADAAQRCAEYGFRLRYGDLPECARRQQLADRQRASGEPVTAGCMKAPGRLVCF